METIESQPNLQQFAVKHGLLVGILISFLALLIYIVDYTLLVHWSYSLTSFIISISIVIYFGIQYRKSGSGYLPFSKSYQLAFFIMAISGIVQILFGIILYHVIDPELPQLITKAAIENMEGMFRSMGMSQGKIDEQILRLKKEMPEQFTVVSQLKNSWLILLFAALLALVAGAIIKKNEPIIENF